MNKKILAIPVIGAVIAAVVKKKSSSGQEQQAAPPAASGESGPDASTDGMSAIR